MSVAVHITCQHMWEEDYHAAYGNDDVKMFEVWESPEHFEAHRENLFAAIQCAGVDSAGIEIHSLHSPHPD